MSSINPVIDSFSRKSLNATEISKRLESVYNVHALSYCTAAKWVPEFKHSQRAFEDSSRTDRSSTIITHQNIQALPQILMRDRQISVRRLAYELSISTTAVYEINSNHLDMKKVSTR